MDGAGKPHEGGQGASSPLAPRCIELLGLAKVLSAGSEFVFPGRSNEKPMSNMVLLMTMRRMKSEYRAWFPVGVSRLGI